MFVVFWVFVGKYDFTGYAGLATWGNTILTIYGLWPSTILGFGNIGVVVGGIGTIGA